MILLRLLKTKIELDQDQIDDDIGVDIRRIIEFILNDEDKTKIIF